MEGCDCLPHHGSRLVHPFSFVEECVCRRRPRREAKSVLHDNLSARSRRWSQELYRIHDAFEQFTYALYIIRVIFYRGFLRLFAEAYRG